MKRLVAATSWILAGGALTGGVYWTFLNTPESTVGALVLSAALGLVAFALLALTVNGALAAWSVGLTRVSLRQSISRLPLLVPAGAIVLIAWWLVGRATGHVSAHSGEISAWFIARFGWADISALLTGIDWAGWWLRWILAPMIALSLVAAVLGAGWSALAKSEWLRRAASPIRLAFATVWFVVLVAAPWVYVAPWRPARLPATSIEIAFIAVKLAGTAILMSIGVALMTREAARTNP